jgi:regulatory protein
MKITGIEKKTKTRYTVEVDGDYFYIFDLEILQENHLKTGMEVDEAFLEDLKKQAELRRARERAFYLLSYRDHSEKELYDKLCKNVSPEAAAAAVGKMAELHLLNDEAYAQKLAEYYLNGKLWSRRKALFEMSRKGISKEMAQEALSACVCDPTEQIGELIRRKYYRTVGDSKGNQKVVNALLRLGYAYSDIKTAMSEYEIEEEEDQWQYE